MVVLLNPAGAVSFFEGDRDRRGGSVAVAVGIHEDARTRAVASDQLARLLRHAAAQVGEKVAPRNQAEKLGAFHNNSDTAAIEYA